MAQIGMTIGKRVDICNQMPTYGNLETMLESKALRGVLVENFSKTQMEAYKITSVGNGFYEVDESTKDTPTMVTFDELSLAAFKNFINRLSSSQMVNVKDASLFQDILNLE